ncbi:MAG: ornithine cyclodeaminase family protein [Candidatus Omnitrophota bacterium]
MLAIGEKSVRRILDEKTAFRLAKEAFELIGRGKTKMPPKIYLELPGDPPADFRAMPAFLKSKKGKVCGIKWVSVFPGNPSFRRPTVNGTILLNSPLTGELLALLEGNTITALRTAAAAAVATKFMANPRPLKLALVGAGLQAEHQLRALLRLYPFKKICVWGHRAGEARDFCRRFRRLNPILTPSLDIQSCVLRADIIVTCTPSHRPLVKKEWVKPGAHINAIGADAKGKEELDPALLRGAKVVVDEWEQASHSGEINVPVSKGLFSRRHLYAELAEIVGGKKKGRASVDDITVFDSTGLAILDIYFAQYVHDAYKRL